MANNNKKKTRRQYRARPQADAGPAVKGSAAPATVPTTAARSSATPAVTTTAAGTATKAAAIGQEYRYVISDLKRIGITAASMFALLVVVALIIT